jgi:hypothetical protein
MGRIVRMAVAGVLLVGLGAAPALAGDDEVRREGSCSGRTDWEMRVKGDDGAFRVRWRADSRIPGQTWRLRLFQDGELIAASTRTTNRDGEATVDLRGVDDRAGTDRFTGKARNPNTGETCSGRATA